MPISRTYLDSYYVIEMALDGPVKDDVERMLYRLSRGSFEIIIPQIVLGESVSQILQKSNSSNAETRLSELWRLINRYNIDIHRCLAAPFDRAFWIMTELESIDSNLDRTDIMILSHALSDENSKFFLTPDGKLVGNPRIIEFEKRLRVDSKRTEKLKITDSM